MNDDITISPVSPSGSGASVHPWINASYRVLQVTAANAALLASQATHALQPFLNPGGGSKAAQKSKGKLTVDTNTDDMELILAAVDAADPTRMLGGLHVRTGAHLHACGDQAGTSILHIGNLHVESQHRRQGVGTALLNVAVHRLSTDDCFSGVTALHCGVEGGEPSALGALLRKAGFQALENGETKQPNVTVMTHPIIKHEPQSPTFRLPRGSYSAASTAEAADDDPLAMPKHVREDSGVSATFSLRCATSNVCVFPFVTRNKHAVNQFLLSLVTCCTIGVMLFQRFCPWMPLVVQLLLAPVLAMPMQVFIIPLQGVLMVLLTCGRWHDHKRGRLNLLMNNLDNLDCIALQELYSGSLDFRYRNYVISEAKKRGLHYSVYCGFIPELPAWLLNTGIMILSRYPILSQRSMVFPTKAFYDYLIVNRGASYACIEMPSHQVVHYFTCHIAPPLKEVTSRAKWLKLCNLNDPQQKQLEELVGFMRECIDQYESNWKTLHSRSKSPTSQSQGAACPAFRPQASIVLAGDFNLDAGSERYFWFLGELRKLDVEVRDVFATNGEKEVTYPKALLQLHQHQRSGVENGTICLQDDQEQAQEEAGKSEPEASKDEKQAAATMRKRASNGHGKSASPAPPPVVPVPPVTPRRAKAAAAAAAACARPFSERSHIPFNFWHEQKGNGREAFDDAAHEPLMAMIRALPQCGASSKAPASPPQSPGRPANGQANGCAVGNASRAGDGPCHLKWEPTFGQIVSPSQFSASCSMEPSAPPHPKAGAGKGRNEEQEEGYLETFLTHHSLLGTHSTHDFMFASCGGVNQRVEPFFTAEATEALQQGGVKGLMQSRGRFKNKFTQLSDHSALIATLLLPEQEFR